MTTAGKVCSWVALLLLLVVPLTCLAAKTSEVHQLLGGLDDTACGTETCQLTCANIVDAVNRFSKVLQFETVSDRGTEDRTLHPEQFKALLQYLETSYPEVWSTAKVEKLGKNGYSLLITWAGSKPELEPILFVSHLDVVPVAQETLDQWTHPPFSGAIAEGYIWGRGALDVKIGVVGLLEASTLLIKAGWAPTRTILLAFGQDEEVGGDMGAGLIAQHLQDQGVTSLDAVIDEGTTVFVEGFPPYSTSPIALVATAEKGYYSIKVHVQGKGGHSSIPPIDHTSAGTAAGRLLLALDAQPPPAALVPPITDFLVQLAPSVEKPWLRDLFSQPDKPEYADRILNAHMLVDTPLTAALARTTVAVTGIQAYVGDNVLPPSATLNLNFRLLPGHTVDTVMDYIKGIVEEQGLLNVTYEEVRPGAPASEALATPVTSTSGRHYAIIKQALQEEWSAVYNAPLTVAPFMLTGGTDSKHYLPMSKGGVLRFVPTTTNFTAGDAGRVHGVNERLSVKDFNTAVCVYKRVLELTAAE